MNLSRKNKVTLSKQLRLGVGRGYSKNNLLKYAGFGFLAISFVLLGFTGYEIIKHSNTPASNPQVLGAADNKSKPFVNYTVQKGDTVFNIAQKYNLNWVTVATINNLSAPYALKAGQTLLLPNQ